MYVLWRVIVKELLQLKQDRRILPLIFVSPVMQILLFGFAVNTDVNRVPLLLVDQDGTAASRELADRFVASGYFNLAGSEKATGPVDDWLVTGRAQLALVIAPGFGAARATDRPARVQLLADGTDSSSVTVALGYASNLIASTAGGPSARAGLVELMPRVFYNPDLKSRWFYLPAVLAMVLLIMTTILSAMGVVREREIGTMEQLLVTPIRPWQLLVGKLFPFALIGLIQLHLITAVLVFGFRLPLRGSFGLLLAFSGLYLFCTLSLGLLVSTLVRNQQQAMMTATFLVAMPMIYLSGLIFPIENMPEVVQLITYGIPLRYYAEILRGLFLRGSGFEVLWPQAAALVGLGLVLLTVASLRFRKRLD
ncbi:MAG TPA: ABC transporter permease [Thermoanaerobaculia bacterium]|nr:ABC transporter permease [Thermoanaerobaculia bacterium]